MPDTFNLQQLLDLAEQQSEKAAATLGGLNRDLAREQEKLALLMRYRLEYQQRLRTTITEGIDGTALRNFHRFMEKLEQAIVQQQAMLAASQKRAVSGKQDWQKKQLKFKAFDTLSDRFESSLRKRDAVREQKLFDELAGRKHRESGDH